MTKIVEAFRHIVPEATTTCREIGSYATEDTIAEILGKLERSGYSGEGRVCYVFGMGAQSRSAYADLEVRAGISVVHYESILPRLLRFVPGYRGLVKIEEPSMLRVVFENLMESSTAGAYVFDAAHEARFVDAVRDVDKSRDRSFGIESDPGYLIYLVDADRDDSPTGMVDFLSYGQDGPWKDIFDAKGDGEDPSA